MNDFTQVGKKESSPRRQNLSSFFFLPSWHFVAIFVDCTRARLCRRRRRSALPLFFSLSLSLTPSRALLHRVAERSDDDRSRGEGEREGGGASPAFVLVRGDTRLRLDFSSSLVFLFKGGGSTLRHKGDKGKGDKSTTLK